MKYKYSVNIIWSDEDDSFVATVPEFEGLMAFGDTYDEAVREIKNALEGYIDEYRDNGFVLPEPIKLKKQYYMKTRVELLEERVALLEEDLLNLIDIIRQEYNLSACL